jgi:hypothetical protein
MYQAARGMKWLPSLTIGTTERCRLFDRSNGGKQWRQALDLLKLKTHYGIGVYNTFASKPTLVYRRRNSEWDSLLDEQALYSGVTNQHLARRDS